MSFSRFCFRKPHYLLEKKNSFYVGVLIFITKWIVNGGRRRYWLKQNKVSIPCPLKGYTNICFVLQHLTNSSCPPSNRALSSFQNFQRYLGSSLFFLISLPSSRIFLLFSVGFKYSFWSSLVVFYVIFWGRSVGQRRL